MHKIQWTLSKISKPDGFEFHKKALFKNKHKKALLEQINKDNKPGKVLKKLLYKEGKRTFRENNYFGLYYKSTKKSCFDGAYSDFLGACCRLINCSRGILFRVLNKIESKMEIAERVLSFKNEQKEISPIYKERSVNLRKKMKLISPVKKRGPLRFLRKWQNLQNGDFYYDCLCNNMVPTKIFTNARKHLYKTTCLVN
ncbi:hypothetical protein MHBO_004696 [Bonamia ostreae]|uniref:Uncharacterized protein n=1 Tax=Bonamia ostreae TaxID=126728 RepID=A0ABV2AUU1_9EUKA